MKIVNIQTIFLSEFGFYFFHHFFIQLYSPGGLEGSEAQQKSLGQALSDCSGELQRQMAAVMLTQEPTALRMTQNDCFQKR